MIDIFLLNELSIHEQFQSADDFKHSFVAIMKIKNRCTRFQHNLYCSSSILYTKPLKEQTVFRVISSMRVDEKAAILSWLSRAGPFWELSRCHNPDDFFECYGVVVTDTSLGECAHLCHVYDKSFMVSIKPSNWEEKILNVKINDCEVIKVVNCLDLFDVDPILDTLTFDSLRTWEQLKIFCEIRYESIIFSVNAFEYLDGSPFSKSLIESIVKRLNILDKYVGTLDAFGNRSTIGNEIYQEYFVGNKAWFSDSSDSEKDEFRNELTFTLPQTGSPRVLCSNHGKIKTPQTRIHYHLEPKEQKVYVVYVGPKITKR